MHPVWPKQLMKFRMHFEQTILLFMIISWHHDSKRSTHLLRINWQWNNNKYQLWAVEMRMRTSHYSTAPAMHWASNWKSTAQLYTTYDQRVHWYEEEKTSEYSVPLRLNQIFEINEKLSEQRQKSGWISNHFGFKNYRRRQKWSERKQFVFHIWLLPLLLRVQIHSSYNVFVIISLLIFICYVVLYQ